MSWKEKISPEEMKIVEELKRRTIKDVTPKMLEDESLFYRFCKARDFVLYDAETMLRKHIIWRKEFQSDSLLTDYKPPEVIANYVPFSFIGFDKEGGVIRYVDYGNADMKGLFVSARNVDFLKFSLKTVEEDLERLKEQSKKLGKQLTALTFIFNFENLTFSNATNKKTVETLLSFAKSFQDNYPERAKRIFFINASIYFYLAFNIVKNVLASALLQKIRCHGSDGWKEDLLQEIDADVLPAFLGGNRTDPDGDPRCKTIIKFGQKVPESYYLCNSEKRLWNSGDAKKLVVTRLSREERVFEVKKSGSCLEWEFETKDKDIAFTICFKERTSKDSRPVELIPKQRLDTYYEPAKGMFNCDKPGIYIVVFDNSYSWIHSKEIYYKISITSPKDNEVYIN